MRARAPDCGSSSGKAHPRRHIADVRRYLSTASSTDQFHGRYRVSATGAMTGRRGIFLADSHEWTTILASYARAYDWAGVAAGLTNRIRMALVSSRFVPTLRLDATQPLDEIVGALNHFHPDSLIGYGQIPERAIALYPTPEPVRHEA